MKYKLLSTQRLFIPYDNIFWSVGLISIIFTSQNETLVVDNEANIVRLIENDGDSLFESVQYGPGGFVSHLGG